MVRIWPNEHKYGKRASTSTAKEPTVAQTASQQQGERDLSQVKVLTLDVGGSAIKYGVCNGLGELSFKGQEPTPNEPDSKVEDLINAFKWIVQKNYGQPLADLVEQATGMRPVVENDAKAAAAAELWIGALQNVQSGAVLILGTGLGGGLVIDGKVYHGPRGSAGELSAFVHNCPSFTGDLDCESSHHSSL